MGTNQTGGPGDGQQVYELYETYEVTEDGSSMRPMLPKLVYQPMG